MRGDRQFRPRVRRSPEGQSTLLAPRISGITVSGDRGEHSGRIVGPGTSYASCRCQVLIGQARRTVCTLGVYHTSTVKKGAQGTLGGDRSTTQRTFRMRSWQTDLINSHVKQEPNTMHDMSWQAVRVVDTLYTFRLVVSSCDQSSSTAKR